MPTTVLCTTYGTYRRAISELNGNYTNNKVCVSTDLATLPRAPFTNDQAVSYARPRNVCK